jgi:hypothetical protein
MVVVICMSFCLCMDKIFSTMKCPHGLCNELAIVVSISYLCLILPFSLYLFFFFCAKHSDKFCTFQDNCCHIVLFSCQVHIVIRINPMFYVLDFHLSSLKGQSSIFGIISFVFNENVNHRKTARQSAHMVLEYMNSYSYWLWPRKTRYETLFPTITCMIWPSSYILSPFHRKVIAANI